MSGQEPSATAATDSARAGEATDDEITRPTDLTIADAARALGTGRQLVRRKLHAGEFPNATKDAQGFWRIPERDLLDAGLATVDATANAGSAPAATSVSGLGEADELQLLRVEVLELRHRVERAEALLEAERRLSEERARALEAERSTLDAVYRQAGLTRPAPRPPETTRVDWQASMRAARERDLEQRASRDREDRQRGPRPNPTAPDDAAPAEVDVMAGPGDKATLTEAVDVAATRKGDDGRHRWRRR